MFGTTVKDGLSSLQNLSADDILSVLGLEKRRSAVTSVVLPSVALFAAGAVVGAAAAVLLAPKSGEALRRDLTAGAKDLSNRLQATAQSVQDYVGTTRNHVNTSAST